MSSMHQQVVAVRLRQQRAAQQQRLAGATLVAVVAGRRVDHHLALPALALRYRRASSTGLRNLRLEGGQRPAANRERLAHHALRGLAQDLLGTGVGQRDAEIAIEHDHTGGEVRQHAGQPGIGQLEPDPVAFDLRAGILQLSRHRVERLRQHAEFVAADVVLDRPEVAFGHRTRAGSEHRQRPGHPAGEQEGGGDGREHREQHGDRQGHAEDPLQADPRQRQFLVVAEARLHGLGVSDSVVGTGCTNCSSRFSSPSEGELRRDDRAHLQAPWQGRAARRTGAARRRSSGLDSARSPTIGAGRRRRLERSGAPRTACPAPATRTVIRSPAGSGRNW